MNYFVGEKKCYFEILTWHKTNPVPTCNNKYLSDTEYCLMFREKKTHLGGTMTTKRKYWISPLNVADKAKFKHPTIKPLQFVLNHILNSTNKNDIILDPFIGSGTTAVACKIAERHFIGFETNPEYQKIACQRIAAQVVDKSQITK